MASRNKILAIFFRTRFHTTRVKSHRSAEALGTVDLPQKADVSTNWRPRAQGSDIPLTFRRDGERLTG